MVLNDIFFILSCRSGSESDDLQPRVDVCGIVYKVNIGH